MDAVQVYGCSVNELSRRNMSDCTVNADEPLVVGSVPVLIWTVRPTFPFHFLLTCTRTRQIYREPPSIECLLRSPNTPLDGLTTQAWRLPLLSRELDDDDYGGENQTIEARSVTWRHLLALFDGCRWQALDVLLGLHTVPPVLPPRRPAPSSNPTDEPFPASTTHDYHFLSSLGTFGSFYPGAANVYSGLTVCAAATPLSSPGIWPRACLTSCPVPPCDLSRIRIAGRLVSSGVHNGHVYFAESRYALSLLTGVSIGRAARDTVTRLRMQRFQPSGRNIHSFISSNVLTLGYQEEAVLPPFAKRYKALRGPIDNVGFKRGILGKVWKFIGAGRVHMATAGRGVMPPFWPPAMQLGFGIFAWSPSTASIGHGFGHPAEGGAMRYCRPNCFI